MTRIIRRTDARSIGKIGAKPYINPAKIIRRAIQPQQPLEQPRKYASRPLPRPRVIASARNGVKTVNSRDVSGEDKKRIREFKGIGEGKLLVIIGNGPSISEAPLQILLGEPNIHLMSVNKPDPRLWPTPYWVFFDRSQLARHQGLWDNYEGTIINSTAIKDQKSNSLQIRNLSNSGFSKDLINGIHIGRSSVYAAIQVGFWMDYDHIYIFGCDMASIEVNGKMVTYFYGDNPDVKSDDRIERFEEEAKFYDRAARDLSENDRSRITFCSSYNKWDFVSKFNKLDHRKAVSTILQESS